MRTWSDIAHTQQSENKTRSGHLAACAAHARAQLRTHDRRPAGGEPPRPIERERHQKDCCARAPSEIAVRAVLDFAAPIDRRCPPLAAPRCGHTFAMSRNRPAHTGTHIPAQIEHENIIERAMTGLGLARVSLFGLRNFRKLFLIRNMQISRKFSGNF